jgi:soluble lytic murein transglycosylase-like protein
MMPAAVTDVLARIAEISAPPVAATRFASMLAPAMATATPTTAASAASTATATTTTGTGNDDSVAQQATVVARAGGPTTDPATDTTVPVAPGALPAGAAQYGSLIDAAATKNGVDPKLLTALVWTESSFHPEVVSPSGAIGLAQLMPATAATLGVDPTDPAQNLDGAARFLAGLQKQFGRADLALAAYNAGPAAVQHAVGTGAAADAVPGAGYAATVLSRYRALGGSSVEAS